MRVDDGEFVFLVGPSGSGKSTILRLLTAEEAPTEGRLMVNGYNLNNIRPHQVPYLRRTLGVVFQDFRLIEKKTVYENMSFAMRAIGAPPGRCASAFPMCWSWWGWSGRRTSFPASSPAVSSSAWPLPGHWSTIPT